MRPSTRGGRGIQPEQTGGYRPRRPSSRAPASASAGLRRPPPSAPIDVAVGSSHACVLDDGGRVYCWGDNEFGQLGAGDYRDRPAPMHVAGLPPITRIVAQRSRTCAFDMDGNIWCWGDSASDRFCMPLRELDPCPGARACWPVPLLVSAGDPDDLFDIGSSKFCRYHDGRFECCGGHSGETPGDVSWAVERFEMNTHYGCALLSDGRLQCWGSDSSGRVGDGDREDGVALPSGVRGFALGDLSACALLDDGSVSCWGEGAFGAVGIAIDEIPARICGGLRTPSCVNVPTGPLALPRADAIYAGDLGACARTVDGELWCWGSLADKVRTTAGSGTVACGIDSTIALGCIELPERVEGIESPSDVGVGGGARCAIVGEHVWCWGYAVHGQLGDGSYTDEVFLRPVQVIGF